VHAVGVAAYGPRWGTPADLAATATWRTGQVRRYGRTDTVAIAEVICLWYGSFHTRTVRVVLVCATTPRTRDRDDRGYGLPLVTTDLTSTAEELVGRYACRWGIDQVFADVRQVLGVGEARNRLRRAVARTVPFGPTCRHRNVITRPPDRSSPLTRPLEVAAG
jgi:hypothetical protein